MEDYAIKRKAGKEGTIVKNINHMWVPKRSNELCKLKAIETADLMVVDVIEGTGKYVGMVGALKCKTEDGLLEVNVGSGFSDAERKEFFRFGMINSVIEVLYNEVIKSKGKDKASLFLPRFECVRFDKTVANTLGELK
jgi:DNA ligase-1